MTRPSADDIEALLPQTQCGLCNYEGCKPYAKAMAAGEANINLCPPGGIETLHTLAEKLNQDPTPFLEEMQQKSKPPAVVVIDETACIGCTKCIQACPVDAIMGARKLMHTVIADECTGCELCIEPCPVDCIDIVPIEDTQTPEEKKQQAQRYRSRFEYRNARLKRDSLEQALKHRGAKNLMQGSKADIAQARRNEIRASMAREQARLAALKSKSDRDDHHE